MPNYNGVWSLSTQYQYAADWAADNPTDFNRAIFAGGISDPLDAANLVKHSNVDAIGISSIFHFTDFTTICWSKTSFSRALSTWIPCFHFVLSICSQ
mgnify:CR=1 FL=1